MGNSKIIFIWALLFLLIPSVKAISLLDCSILPTDDITNSAYQPLVRLSNQTNAHAQQVNDTISSNNYYNYTSYCRITGYSLNTTDCTDEYPIFLSNTTNAHSSNFSDYTGKTCLSSPDGDLFCELKNSCTSDEEAILSMSNITNAHIGDTNYYSNILCCSFTAGAVIVSEGGGGGGLPSENITIEIIIPNEIQREKYYNFSIFFYDKNNNLMNLTYKPTIRIYPFNPLELKSLEDYGLNGWIAEYFVPLTAEYQEYSFNVTYNSITEGKTFEIIQKKTIFTSFTGYINENIIQELKKRNILWLFWLSIALILLIIAFISIEVIRYIKKKRKNEPLRL